MGHWRRTERTDVFANIERTRLLAALYLVKLAQFPASSFRLRKQNWQSSANRQGRIPDAFTAYTSSEVKLARLR
jgi:hypothetical protein